MPSDRRRTMAVLPRSAGLRSAQYRSEPSSWGADTAIVSPASMAGEMGDAQLPYGAAIAIGSDQSARSGRIVGKRMTSRM